MYIGACVSAPKHDAGRCRAADAGIVHDTAAARIWNVLAALRQAGLICLADKGYHGLDGSGTQVITLYRGRDKPASQKAATALTPGSAVPANGTVLTYIINGIRHHHRLTPHGIQQSATLWTATRIRRWLGADPRGYFFHVPQVIAYQPAGIHISSTDIDIAK